MRATVAARPLGWHPGEGRVLAQDGGLQLAQLRSRLQSELVVEHLADLAQRVERVRLPPRPGEGQRPQRPEPLAQRVRRGQRLELGRDGAVVTEGERGDGPVLERDPAQLLEPGPLGDGGGRVLEVDVRDPAPERQRLVEVGDRRGQVRSRTSAGGSQTGSALAEPAVDGGDRAVEPGGVERVRRARAVRSRARR